MIGAMILTLMMQLDILGSTTHLMAVGADDATIEDYYEFTKTCSNSEFELRYSDNAIFVTRTNGDTIATTIMSREREFIGYSIMLKNQ